ncbi:putative integral membrane protein [Corynebacterium diphtheriae C7 (beta)]
MVAQFGEFGELSEQQRDTIRELKAGGRVVEAVRKTRVWYPSLGLVEAKKLVDEL